MSIMINTSSGTYAKLVPDDSTTERITEIIELINIPEYVSRNAMHCTVVYSRVVCDLTSLIVPLPMFADGAKFDIFNSSDGSKCLVLKLESFGLFKLHAQCRDIGATHDFSEFNPHITLSYNYPYDDVPNSSLLSYFKNLTFNQFIVEPLNFEWHE